jgi:hypothetical protein
MRICRVASCVALMLSVKSTAAVAQTAHVRIIEGENLWAKFPDGFEKPTARWEGKVLYVRVITTRANFEMLKDDQASLSLDRSVLHLTFRMKPVVSPLLKPGELPPPGVAVPMLLEFKVEGLARRGYRILVSRPEG